MYLPTIYIKNLYIQEYIIAIYQNGRKVFG